MSGPWEIYSRLNFKEHCKLEFILFCLEIFFTTIFCLLSVNSFFSVRTMFMGGGSPTTVRFIRGKNESGSFLISSSL